MRNVRYSINWSVIFGLLVNSISLFIFIWCNVLLLHAELNRFQYHINSIPSVLYAMGLRHAVISPGSRNAPLIMAFARFGKIKCHSVIDERSAGFVALGMAKQTGIPAAVICTSGSALANIYPAVLEAFYMQVPLLVISADRPPEMIDKWDGQTIHQYPFFFNHIKASFNLNVFRGSDCIDEYMDICADFYKSSMNGVHGPSHLNVPMDEPLYAAVNEEFEYPHYTAEAAQNKPLPVEQLDAIVGVIASANKVMVLIGANENQWQVPVNNLEQLNQVVVLADVISNNRKLSTIDNWEATLLSVNENEAIGLLPEILITCGKMVLNKRLKQLLRKTKNIQHFHLEPNAYCPDTFDKKPEVLTVEATLLCTGNLSNNDNSKYKQNWLNAAQKRQLAEAEYSFSNASELGFVKYLLENLGQKNVLHLSNSFSIRNAAYLAQYLNKDVIVHCNRGVSGIDGCTSTAVGMSICDETKSHVLLTGDVAFLYDNAFLIQELPANLKIVVINNDGGGIFRLIEGPNNMKELESYMTTPHGRNLSYLAKLHGLEYMQVDTNTALNKQIQTFFGLKGMAILEFNCEQIKNTEQFNKFKSI